jgi:thymidylate kinase
VQIRNGKQAVENQKNSFPLVSALRSVLVAYDRRSLLKKAFSRAANGTIVLCDRFPSSINGAPDSPSLGLLLALPSRHSPRRLLARLEERLYRSVPGPALIIRLDVPLEVAIMRNRTRGKEEPEDFVRLRHAQSSRLDFSPIHVHKMNTDRSFSRTLLETKKIIWNSL